MKFRPNFKLQKAQPYLKWDKVEIALQHHCVRTLEGVKRLRQEWNEMFAQRLNPKRYKFSEEDEKLIETISTLLANEGKSLAGGLNSG